jgi:guanine nucleotide-binding protein subunit alpha
MRLIHDIPFTPREIETYRHVIFDNLTRGMLLLFEAMAEMEIPIPDRISAHREILSHAPEIQDRQPYPPEFKDIILAVWNDPDIQAVWQRAAEAALPEK